MLSVFTVYEEVITLTFSLFVSITSIIIVSFVVTFFVLKYTLKQQILDIPNERSSHTIVTPRGGGLGFVIIFLLSLCILVYLGKIGLNLCAAMLGGGLLIAAVGWKDDKKPVNPIIRFICQIIVAVWAVYWLGGFSALNVGFSEIQLSWIGNIFAVIGTVWMINMYNFMDGVDGIAGTEAVITAAVCGFFLLLGKQAPDLGLVCIVLVASITGFLLWNWPPATIFMGDVGSGFLGFIFACLAIASENTGAIPLLVWILLLGVFVIDSTSTLILRICQGKKWYEPHRSHVYQLAVQAGFSHKQVTLTVLTINCVLGIMAYWIFRMPNFFLPISLTTAVILLLVYIFLRKHFTKIITDLDIKQASHAGQGLFEAASSNDK